MKKFSILKFLGLLALVLVLVGGTNYLQFYFNNKTIAKLEEDYKNQIAVLQEQIDSLGDWVTTFTVKEGIDIYPGLEIKQEMLDTVTIPSSFIKDSEDLDPANFVGKYFKVAVKPGTRLTSDLAMSRPLDDTDREMDIIAIDKPVGLREGDYVDLIMTHPKGEDQIILPYLRINKINGDTYKVILPAIDQQIYGGALVDMYLQRDKGMLISMRKYVEPGVQKPAEAFYAVPANIVSAITANPNIVEKAEASIQAQLRAAQDLYSADLPQDIYTKLAAGRSEVSSKISGSYQQWKAEQEERQRQAEEARKNAEIMGDYAPESESTLPPMVQPGSDLKIEEGALE